MQDAAGEIPGCSHPGKTLPDRNQPCFETTGLWLCRWAKSTMPFTQSLRV